jgi:hypothetical protein
MPDAQHQAEVGPRDLRQAQSRTDKEEEEAPGTDVTTFKIFSPKYFAKKWRFLLNAKLNYAKI